MGPYYGPLTLGSLDTYCVPYTTILLSFDLRSRDMPYTKLRSPRNMPYHRTKKPES